MEQAPSIDRHLAGLPSDPEALTLAVPGVVKTYLAEARAHLDWIHRSPQSGRRVNEANSDLIDRLVTRLQARQARAC